MTADRYQLRRIIGGSSVMVKQDDGQWVRHSVHAAMVKRYQLDAAEARNERQREHDLRVKIAAELEWAQARIETLESFTTVRIRNFVTERPPLKPLAQHEAERHKAHIDQLRSNRSSSRTGVACPKCGMELLADRTAELTSIPPRVRVWCESCSHTGSITK